jgi:hypothetical protein
MSFLNRHFNNQFETVGAAKVPKAVGDRYWGQDFTRENRYLQGLAGRLFLQSFGVNTALLSGGLVTVGSSKTRLNITAAVGIADYDIDVQYDDSGWAVPAATETRQIPVRVEAPAQTDFDISGATLDGVTTNYLKLRYAELNVQSRVKQFASGSFFYSVSESYVLAADSSAPTTKDIVLATFIGNGTTTLTITQRYPIGPAGQQMALCAAYGLTYDGTDAFIGEKLSIVSSKPIGSIVTSTIGLTPSTWTGSRNTSNPTGSIYNPIIPIHDANHDISTSQVPQSVIDVLNSNKIVVKNGSGTNVSSFSATLASGVLTFTSTTENNAFLAMLQEAGMVNQWYASGEIATWADSGALWTGARQYSVTINGVNYAITGVNTVSRTITLATYPSDGAVTVECGPTRIAGSTTSARLRRVSGEAMVAGGDISSLVGVGMARTDRMQGHRHLPLSPMTKYVGDTSLVVSGGSAYGTPVLSSATTGDPTTDTVNGTTRTGKTTDPRTFGIGIYIHLGILLATTWTSAA